MSEEYLKSPLSAPDPKAYLEAPSLMVTSRRSAEPHTVEQSVIAVQEFQPLSGEDFQVVQSELSILSGRISEVEQQLNIERKMGEAASLLGRLHQSSGDQNKRKSLFRPNPKRLSKQADDEAQVSQDRVNRLGFAKSELLSRKLSLENRLLKHHAAVLCKALSGEPLNPRPLSLALPSQYPAPSSLDPSPQRVSRRLSTFEFDHGSPNATPRSGGTDAAPMIPPIHSSHSRNASISTLANSFGEPDPSQELATISKRIETALPSVTPNPNKTSFILGAFDHLIREQHRSEKVIESLQLQTEQAEQRVAFLSEKSRSIETTPEAARVEAENKQLKGELDESRKRLRELRDRVDAQRAELQRVTQELEDVTNIAVRSEAHLRGSEQVIAQLEHQTEDQERQLAEKWGNTLTSQQPSVLCKEFRQIIHELSRKHLGEMRSLRNTKLSQAGLGNGVVHGNDPVSQNVQGSQDPHAVEEDPHTGSHSTPPAQANSQATSPSIL